MPSSTHGYGWPNEVGTAAHRLRRLPSTRRVAFAQWHHGSFRVGAVIIAGWLLLALFADILVGDPFAQDVLSRLQPPSNDALFGTDELGRDILSRVVHGARISVPVGIAIIAAAGLFGSLVGAVSGYVGGVVDDLVMRITDMVLAFPSIVLAMAIAAVLGPSLTNAAIAIVAVWWPEFARLMRGQVLATKPLEYVVAARSLGATEDRILLRHIVPNTFAPIVVKASLDVGSAVVLIASLSFIGLGVTPPTPEWGAMIAEGRLKFFDWWLATFPGLAILSVVLAFNFLGDGLRDALDPRWVRPGGRPR